MLHSCRHSLILAVALFTGASAACSSTTSAPGGGGATDGGGATSSGAPGPGATAKAPCELLIRADAEAALSQPLPANAEDKVLRSCQWTTADFASGADITLGDWDSIKAAANAGQGVPVPISGVGDEALNLNGAGGPSILYVRRGSEGFILNVNGSSIDHLADHGLSLEEALARQVLARF